MKVKLHQFSDRMWLEVNFLGQYSYRMSNDGLNWFRIAYSATQKSIADLTEAGVPETPEMNTFVNRYYKGYL